MFCIALFVLYNVLSHSVDTLLELAVRSVSIHRAFA